MAKNDLNLILYKILLYYYGALQRHYRFDPKVFYSLFDDSVDRDYILDVIKMAVDNGFIEGLNYVTAWGATAILVSDLNDGHITIAGVDFLKENSAMRKVTKFLKDSTQAIANLAALVGLYQVTPK